MKRTGRVYVAFAITVLLTQCGLGGREGYRAYRNWQTDQMFARSSVPSVPTPPLPVIPPPSVALPSAPPPSAPPTTVATALAMGPLTLSQMTRADLAARMTRADVSITTDDAPDGGPEFVADIWGNAAAGGVEVLLFDCGRADPSLACSIDENRVITGGTHDLALVTPLLTAEVRTANDLSRALRGAGLHGIDLGVITTDRGLRWTNVDNYEEPRFNGSIREMRDVPRHHGAVHVEGNAVLVVVALDDSYRGAEALVTALLGAQR